MLKVAVIGSRSFNDYPLLEQTLNKIPHDFIVVSGGAVGADSLGEHYAKLNGKETIIFKPDWDKYGKAAGNVRNVQIIHESDIVIAFWDGKSPGTKDSISKARRQGKKVLVKSFVST